MTSERELRDADGMRFAMLQTNEAWVAAETVEALALAGSIEEALSIFGQDGISTLEQHPRLYFKSKRQQFFEHLRQRTPEGLALGIRFLREDLAPLALHAYPEAYEELKQCLLALVYLGEAGAEARFDAISKEWLLEARQVTAAQLARFYRLINGCYDSKLMLLLRYLSLTFNEAAEEPEEVDLAAMLVDNSHFQELASSVSDATRTAVASLGVSLSGRSPPLPPPESISSQVTSATAKVPNWLVMMMKSSLGLRRESVLDCIRAAGGDVYAAFRHELGAIKLNRACVDKLAHEYAAARGLTLEDRRGDAATTDAILEERRGSGNTASPSTQVTDGVASARPSGRHASQSPPKKFARLASPAGQNGVLPSDAAAVRRLRDSQGMTHDHSEALQSIRADIESGRLKEAIDCIQAQDPEFLPAHPALEFELHAAFFHQLLDTGATTQALALARSKLSVVCEQHQSLQPKLKATMARLIPGAAPEVRVSLSSLADSLDAKQRSWLGMQEPRLVTLLEALLSVHHRWFELQQCADPFEGVLGIDSLWPAPKPPLPTPMQTSQQQRPPSDSPQSTNPPTGPSVAFEEVPVQLDEELISEAMDITNLSRAAVMNLLRDVGGNLETLLDNLFQ